jgi:hypothetical protein
MKKVALCAIMGIMAATVCAPAQTTKTRENLISVKKEVDYNTKIQPDYITYSCIPPASTFVNADGSVTVCAFDKKNKRTYIYEYDEELVEQKTLTFTAELDLFGAFTKDKDGNYYFFYGKKTDSQTENNMAMVKYDKNGQKVKTYYLVSAPENSSKGIKIPFDFATCRLEISDYMLAVYFGREEFASSDGKNHQSSFGFVLNKDTFERIDNGAPGTIPAISHSFDQFILPIDSGFVFADLGDGGPRGFAFAKFKRGDRTKHLDSFRFPGPSGHNMTNSQLGGVAKTSTGYIFAGTTPNEPWDDYESVHYNGRHLLILTINEDFSAISSPIKITSSNNFGKSSDSTTYVFFPKIVDLGEGMYLLLWEEYFISWRENTSRLVGEDKFQDFFMQIIDETGKKLTDKIKIEGARIGKYDIPRYNSRNGFVYWSTNNHWDDRWDNVYKEIHVIGLNTKYYTDSIRAAKQGEKDVGRGNTGKTNGTKSNAAVKQIPSTLAQQAELQNGTYTFYPRLRARQAGLPVDFYIAQINVAKDFMLIRFTRSAQGEIENAPSGFYNAKNFLLRDLDNPSRFYNPISARSTNSGMGKIWSISFNRFAATKFSLSCKPYGNTNPPYVFEEIILGEPDK